MTRIVAVQMDHIQNIKIAGDSTFAILLEAQKRGAQIWHYTPERLSFENGVLTAQVEVITVRDEVGNHVSFSESKRVKLADADIVLLRQDPPFDLAYITTTHLLERLPERTLVVNNPQSVRDAPEKMLVMDFPDLMPPTLISRDRREIEDFHARHGEIVMKPLYGHGGANVFKLSHQDDNFGSLFDLFSNLFREPWVNQKFLPEVRNGDKRIILVDGEARGAINRVPAEHDIRSNMVRGGRAVSTELTPREREICERLAPVLKEKGLLFTGIDVIGHWLTEINVTSPTGIRAIKNAGGPDLAAIIWDAIEQKLAQRG